jgi:putative membrane protein
MLGRNRWKFDREREFPFARWPAHGVCCRKVKRCFGLALFVLTPPISAPADASDADFYSSAAEFNLAEISTGTLAQQRGSSLAVREFGDMMAKDHAQANRTLKTQAAVNHVDFPNAASSDLFLAKRAMLVTLSAEEFDRYYINWQIASHREAITVFESEARSGSDADAQAFAVAVLPMLKAHLQILLSSPLPVG